MIGRSTYKHPLRWSAIDQKVYGTNTKPKSASDIIFSLIPYLENHLKNGGNLGIFKTPYKSSRRCSKSKNLEEQISIKSLAKELDSEYLFTMTNKLEEMGY